MVVFILRLDMLLLLFCMFFGLIFYSMKLNHLRVFPFFFVDFVIFFCVRSLTFHLSRFFSFSTVHGLSCNRLNLYSNCVERLVALFFLFILHLVVFNWNKRKWEQFLWRFFLYSSRHLWMWMEMTNTFMATTWIGLSHLRWVSFISLSQMIFTAFSLFWKCFGCDNKYKVKINTKFREPQTSSTTNIYI